MTSSRGMILLVFTLLLVCWTGYCSAECSAEDEVKFRNEHLDGDCRAKLSLLQIKSTAAALNEIELDSLCSTSCLGKYSNWLNITCNNTAKASFQRAACMKQLDGREKKRCRLYFPDFTNISSTKQCVVLIPDMQTPCTSECRDPLQIMIAKLGCCFQAIYDDPLVTEGLSQERFIHGAESSALTLFQTSNVLSRCTDMTPPTCADDPFMISDTASGAEGFRSTSRLPIFLAVGLLALLSCMN